MFGRRPPICLIPISLPGIAIAAEDLKIAYVEREFRVFLARLDVIDVDDRPGRLRCAATHTLSTVSANRLIAKLAPRPGRIVLLR